MACALFIVNQVWVNREVLTSIYQCLVFRVSQNCTTEAAHDTYRYLQESITVYLNTRSTCEHNVGDK